MKGNWSFNIQALRGLAVLLVVIRHLQIYMQRSLAGTDLLGDFAGGNLGVDLFFVISGCVMAMNHGQGSARPGDVARFLYHRAARIYPLYWFWSLWALAIFLIRPEWLHRLDQGMPVDLIRSFLLWPQAGWPLLGQAWSLVFELYYYLVFAGLLCLPARHLRSGLLAWALALAAGNLFFADERRLFVSPELGVIFAPLTLEFIAGALVGLIISGRDETPAWRPAVAVVLDRIALVLSCLAILTVLTLQKGPSSPPDWQRAAEYGLPCVFLVYGAVQTEKAGVRLPRVLGWVGRWSYSIYLSHIFVIAALFRLRGRQPMYNWWQEVALAALVVAGVLLVGALSYHYLEAALLRSSRLRRPAAWRKENWSMSRDDGGTRSLQRASRK